MKICFSAKNNFCDKIGFIPLRIRKSNKTYLISHFIFFVYFLSAIFHSLPTVAQIQWASAIKECSQENNCGDFSPQKILGQPNAEPNNKANSESWTINFSENQTNVSIEVTFDEAIKVRKIFIAENLGIGLKTILLKDDKGHEHETYAINENYDFGLKIKSKVSHIILYKPTNYLVKSIKLVISPPFMGNLSQLDGIGISSFDIPFEYEQIGNKLTLPTNFQKIALQQKTFTKQAYKAEKTIASIKNVTTYFKNREVTKYVLQGRFSNDTVKIDKEIKLQLVNLNTNDSLTLLTEQDGSFQIGLDESEYSLVGFQQGYLATTSNNFSTIGKRINEVVMMNVPIRPFRKGENYIFYEMNFDVNSDSIDTKSSLILEQVYLTLRENPKTLVKIEVHTDARGDDNYNLMLTQKRAKRINTYLQQKGISEKRLTTIGLGETELRNKCGNGVRCDNASHSINRRIEIEILDFLE
jgi:outer membrane protein OmpA-like peptidoglycan-associated protein